MKSLRHSASRREGAHLKFAVEPDVAVFAKAISNGYPMAAIIGTIDVMQAAQETFISSTYWTDRIGPVAALATIRKHRALNVSNRLISLGERSSSRLETRGGRSRN